jgi:hypothetical protein
MLYFNHNRRLTMTDVIDRFVIAEDSQGLSDRLVDTGGTNLPYVHLLEVAAGYFAGPQGHNYDLSYFAFSSP